MKPQEKGQTHNGYRRIIASMTALLEFEAVARHGSFTLAARELGVTQAAVSKQVKLLEEVRYGNGRWKDGEALHLFDEEIFPVCSPAWLARNGEPASLEALHDADLLDADATTEGWITWPTWFRELGENPPKLDYGLRCHLYTDTIQAALHGHGVALGWRRMLDHLLASGELIRLTDFAVRPREAYYLVVPHGHDITPTVRGLVDCLRG